LRKSEQGEPLAKMAGSEEATLEQEHTSEQGEPLATMAASLRACEEIGFQDIIPGGLRNVVR
jgi:hypothetical protein